MTSARECTATASVRVGVRPGAAVPSSACSRFVQALAAATLGLRLVQSADAQQPAPRVAVPCTATLKKPCDSDTLRIGYRENSPPFAFLDKAPKPIRHSPNHCEIVVQEITGLGKDIRFEYKSVAPQNRFDLLDPSGLDLECSATTNNPARCKIAALSPIMFVTGTELLVRPGSAIPDVRELQGKTIVLTRGTPHEASVPKRAFHELAGSRDIVASCGRLFHEPLPPGVRLRIPMSPHLEEIFRVQGLPPN